MHGLKWPINSARIVARSLTRAVQVKRTRGVTAHELLRQQRHIRTQGRGLVELREAEGERAVDFVGTDAARDTGFGSEQRAE